ncbi:hypothetical protein E0485_05905 [Paenibacillus albiflavus]|uniref:Uncharacterized protein n=1 Tax=Paenibacillus albiflavus TaxID=2545760 RepID=A0A4R4EH11_9BACL|nr:hypothetical protein [Paenibacillus albiflavus]TCZ79394.1 hypothetical protein E0485_05905 [Paenibacillus albiflavus]
MKIPPMQTVDEPSLVKSYVLLPLLMDVLERDMATLAIVNLKLPLVYITCLQSAQDAIMAELATLKGQLRNKGIKVYQQERTKQALDVRYLCRGYHHQFTMLWTVVKPEIERMLSEFMQVDLTQAKRLPSSYPSAKKAP